MAQHLVMTFYENAV